MHPLFSVSRDEVELLNDEDARELIARLCKAELRRKNIGTSGVTWGGDQRASDGGIDVSVDLSPLTKIPNIGGYIPKIANGYQVKAEKFGPSRVEIEMMPGGVLRPAIRELARLNGAYILVSTKDNCADSSLRSRKNTMVNCVERSNIDGSLHIDFYDNRRIRDWIENFIQEIIWVKQKAGKPLEGWKPYDAWGFRDTNVHNPYFIDETTRVEVPGCEQNLAISDAINHLRGELPRPNTSVRIIGLSGVGKTRLAQALFDNRIASSNPALDQDSVIYTDISWGPNPRPLALLTDMINNGMEGILIVDNCGQDDHQQLTTLVKSLNSRVRLLTIEYDIRDDIPEDTKCYRLHGSSSNIISSLLSQRFNRLSEHDIQKVVNFSDGNSRVAIALAFTVAMSGELTYLTDDLLFERLFYQRRSSNEEFKRCAEVASLLYSFDFSDSANNSELEILSYLSETSILTFCRHVSGLKDRGLVQERGHWRAVLPHAISNRLALAALKTLPLNEIKKKFFDASFRVRNSFAKRLSYLYDAPEVKSIARSWLSIDGPFKDFGLLDYEEFQLFKYLTPIDPKATLNLILNSIRTMGLNIPFLSLRWDLMRLLRAIAYDEELFEDSARAMLFITSLEFKEKKIYRVNDAFTSLFRLRQSGTLADPRQRSEFVRTLLDSDMFIEWKISLDLLSAALGTISASTSFDSQFGPLKRSYGWLPRTQKEMIEWYSLYLGLAKDIAKISNQKGYEVRKVLARAFSRLWINEAMRQFLVDLAIEINSVVDWPEAWIIIRREIIQTQANDDDPWLNKLRELQKELRPKDLASTVRAKIISQSDFNADMDLDESAGDLTGWYERSQSEAELLGGSIANFPDELSKILNEIAYADTNDKMTRFGIGIGKAATHQVELLDEIKTIIREELSTNMFHLVLGLLEGWSSKHEAELSTFLDNAIDDDTWGPIFPHLQIAVGIDMVGYGRLEEAIALGKAKAHQYSGLAHNSTVDTLSIEQLLSLLTKLHDSRDDAFETVTFVLSMLMVNREKRSTHFNSILRSYCSNLILNFPWDRVDPRNQEEVRHISKVVEFALEDAKTGTNAVQSLGTLIRIELADLTRSPRQFGRILAPYFKYYPSESLDACYIKDSEGQYGKALTLIKDDYGDEPRTALMSASDEVVLEWCKASPEDRCVFVAQACVITDLSNNEESSVATISQIATSLWSIAPNKKEVLKKFVKRCIPSAWSGSLLAVASARLRKLYDLSQDDTSPEHLMINDTIREEISGIADLEEAWDRKNSFE